MKANVFLISDERPITLFVTKAILDALGAESGDTLTLDIPTTHNSLIIYKDKPNGR